MTRLTFQPYARRKHHPGATRGGTVGFYSVIGVAAVGLLIMFGLYLLAQGALQGLAAIVPAAP